MRGTAIGVIPDGGRIERNGLIAPATMRGAGGGTLWPKRCVANSPASTSTTWSIGRPCKTWLYWGMFWLLVAPSVGVALSGLFNYPDYLGTNLETTFGRLRPVHVNGVIFGAFSALFIGECYYLVPRLCGVRVPWPQWSVLLAWVWNITLAAGTHLAGLGREPRPRSRRVSAVRRDPHLHRHGRRDRAVPGRHRRTVSSRRSMSRSGI